MANGVQYYTEWVHRMDSMADVVHCITAAAELLNVFVSVAENQERERSAGRWPWNKTRAQDGFRTS